MFLTRSKCSLDLDLAAGGNVLKEQIFQQILIAKFRLQLHYMEQESQNFGFLANKRTCYKRIQSAPTVQFAKFYRNPTQSNIACYEDDLFFVLQKRQWPAVSPATLFRSTVCTFYLEFFRKSERKRKFAICHLLMSIIDKFIE